MTKTDIAIIDQAEIDALAIELGMDPNATNFVGLPQLKTNGDHEDMDGNPLPAGTFYVPGMEQVVYAKTVRFRPLTVTYQLSEYDQEANKMACRTVENSSHQQEFIDTRGGTYCGRPAPAVWRKMSPEEKKPYEAITAFTILRGLVSYEGKTADGEEAKVENQPVIARQKGVNYSAFADSLGKWGANVPKGRKTWDYWFDVSLTKKKNGSVTYFEWAFAFDPASPVPLDRDTLDTIKAFQEEIRNLNRSVRTEYDAALSKKSGGRLSGQFSDQHNLELEHELDDIPF